ncbi:MarR family transcriptional regulator [Bacillus sp. 1P06AnD]|uniref:MarR family transcriptional regulator n=1 Tax=Bacillus sp. 1P06AnD TaxID=3132208 RepID=UPI0039A376AA
MGVKQERIYDQNDVLYEIYRMRGLTIGQLCEVIFHSKHYAYKFLKRLKDKEYLTDWMDMNGKKRAAKIYMCTDKAIYALRKAGYIDNGIEARYNAPLREKMKYTVLTNEVYAAMMPYGIHMLDSREWKRIYEMDRNALVRGGLRMADGRELALYLFFSENQLSGAKLTAALLKKFQHEILKFAQSNRIAVICYDEKIYKTVVDEITKHPNLMVFKELLIIPFGKDDFGYHLLHLTRSNVERRSDLEEILNARLYDNHPSLAGNKQNFAGYVADYGSHETYIVDFLSMNYPVLHHLMTHYHHENFVKNGREVQIVCWKASEKELERKFARYPHVKVISVSLREIKDKYMPRLGKRKLHELI